MIKPALLSLVVSFKHAEHDFYIDQNQCSLIMTLLNYCMTRYMCFKFIQICDEVKVIIIYM